MVHEEQLKIIQNLMLRYRAEKEEFVFKQILERIDDILVGMVCKIAKIYYFTEPNIQDLYQCAIIGLYKTIDSIKESDDPNYVLNRVYVYVRKEVFQEYGEKKILSFDTMTDRSKTGELCPPEEGMIREERIQFLTSLIVQGIINKDDLDLLVLRFVEGKSIRQIVQENEDRWGRHRSTVKKRIEKLLIKVKIEAEKKSIT